LLPETGNNERVMAAMAEMANPFAIFMVLRLIIRKDNDFLQQ
jgi:hypothetical protein